MSSQRSSENAFYCAASSLNSRNLSDLWMKSCIFSLIEYFDSWQDKTNFLMPTINVEQVLLFHRAILESKAADYKREQFVADDLPKVFNAIMDAGYRGGLLDGDDDPYRRLRRLFATIANTQVRLQQTNILHNVGRAYAMLHVIPQQFKDKLQALQKDQFIDLTTAVPQHTGLTVPDFLGIGFALFTWYRQKFENIFVNIDNLRRYVTEINHSDIANKRRSEILRQIIDESLHWQNQLVFNPVDLVIPDSPIFTLDKVRTYLDLVSKSTGELRALMKQDPVYQLGQVADRLSPLERYPVVRLNSHTYIIPNLRYFAIGLTELLHFILQEHYPGNQYNQLRGYIQEIYVQLLLEDRLPKLHVIPETSYFVSKKRVDGPDLTLVDPDRNALIAVESKSKRMKVATRVAPTSNAFSEDLERAFVALDKLPAKVDDLRRGVPEYSGVQSVIDTTKGTEPILVVVLGEGVYFLPELVQDYLASNDTHALHNCPYAYCVMDLVTFEKAVEIAADAQIPLSEMLREYWNTSRINDIKDHAADGFGGRNAPAVFLKKYGDMLFSELERSFHSTS